MGPEPPLPKPKDNSDKVLRAVRFNEGNCKQHLADGFLQTCRMNHGKTSHRSTALCAQMNLGLEPAFSADPAAIANGAGILHRRPIGPRDLRYELQPLPVGDTKGGYVKSARSLLGVVWRYFNLCIYQVNTWQPLQFLTETATEKRSGHNIRWLVEEASKAIAALSTELSRQKKYCHHMSHGRRLLCVCDSATCVLRCIDTVIQTYLITCMHTLPRSHMPPIPTLVAQRSRVPEGFESLAWKAASPKVSVPKRPCFET